MTDKTKKTLKNTLLGAGVAGVTYALLRKPNYSHVAEIAKAQQASKGKVTSVISPTPYMSDYDVKGLLSTNPLKKVKNWFEQAGIRHIKAENITKPTKIEGAVYDDVNMTNMKWDPSKVRGDINYNSDKAEFRNKLQEKFNFSTMPEFAKYTPQSTLLSKTLKGKTPKSIEELHKALSGKDIFIKIRTGEGVGYGFQGTPDKLLKSPSAKHVLENPHLYLSQPTFKNDREYRVHAFIQNGKVQLGETHVKAKQGKKSIGYSHPANFNKDLSNFTQEALKEYAAKNPTKNMILGVDVMHNTTANKFTIGEINDNSGSFRSRKGSFLLSPHINYKALTGRHSKPASSVLAAGAGVTAASAGALYDNTKQADFDPTTLGTIAGLPLAAYMFYKKRKPVLSADSYLRGIQEASKGSLTISHYGSENKAMQALRQLRHPFVKELSPTKARQVKGAVINIGHGQNITGDVTINHPSLRKQYKEFANVEIKKGLTVPHLSPWLIPTTSLEDALKLHAGTSLKKFQESTTHQARGILRRLSQNGSWYVKPHDSYGSRGIYSNLTELENFSKSNNADRIIPRKYDPQYPKNPIGELQKNPHRYIVQPDIKPVHEMRMHTLGHKIVGSPVNRFMEPSKGRVLGLPAKLPSGFSVPHFEEALKKTLKEKGLDKHPAFLGWDVAVLPDRSVKVIEANPSSGFAFDPDPISQTNKFHKAITGRDTVGVAAAKGVAAGAAVGVPTALLAKKYRKKEASIDKKKAKKIALISGVALGAGGLTALLLEKGISPVIYKKYREAASQWTENIPRLSMPSNLGARFRQLVKIGEKKNKTLKTVGVAAAIGAGAGVTYAALPHAQTHQNVKKLIQSQSRYSGRLPVHPDDAVEMLHDVGEAKLPRAGANSLGKFLRKQTNRPVFGDDSELMVFGVNKDEVPFAENIPGYYKKGKTIKGKNFSIVQDSTVGGLEINVHPGNADDLHRRFHRAITTGAPKILAPDEHALVNNAFMKTTGDFGLGASSHIHFQSPPHELKAKMHRISGATAILNYLVPGSHKRAKGYKGYGASSTGLFGWDFPGIRTWTRAGEEHLLSQAKVPSGAAKKRLWNPDSGNVAAEIRYNAPMHGDPHLSKKYLQLVELGLSNHPATKRLEQLGEHLHKVTGGDSAKLHNVNTRTHVISEFSKMVNSSEFKQDKTLQEFIRLAKNKKTLPTQNVVKMWKNFKI